MFSRMSFNDRADERKAQPTPLSPYSFFTIFLFSFLRNILSRLLVLEIRKRGKGNEIEHEKKLPSPQPSPDRSPKRTV